MKEKMINRNENYNYVEEVEKKVDEIRDKALKIVQVINPNISCVIDPYTVDDYCEKQWDYPGAWYVYFKYPDGIRKEEELIDKIISKTLDYFKDKKSSHREGGLSSIVSKTLDYFKNKK